MEYQIITRSNKDMILHMGVHKLGKVSYRTIKKIERKWQAWRREYIAQHPGNYPLALTADEKPEFVAFYPVGNPKNVRSFSI